MPLSPALLTIMQKHRAEGWTLRQIAAQMNMLGLKTSARIKLVRLYRSGLFAIPKARNVNQREQLPVLSRQHGRF